MTRPARVVIDLDALRHNLQRARDLAPTSKVMAIVKADAYGHGLARVARAFSGADAFGVACLEEAEQLRSAGAGCPIVLLEGPYAQNELNRISSLGLDIVVHQAAQLEMLEHTRLARPLRVWLKVDSGMHRLGFAAQEVAAAWQRLQSCTAVQPQVRFMTHLALANRPDSDMTPRQLAAFAAACGKLPGPRSIANSAALLAWPAAHADWVRPGLMLYGVSPLEGGNGADHGLQPAMTLCSELISIRRLGKGEPVGYGASWRCPEEMPIGVVAAGYGDGFPRHAHSGTPVLVKGRCAATVGFASMDMLTVDLRTVPDARIGDPVILWGPGLPIEEVAKHAQTVPYELICGVHKRLAFVEHGAFQDAVSMQ